MRTFIYDRPFPPLFGIPIAAGKLFQKKKARKEAPVFFCVAKPTSFPTDLQLTLRVKNLQKQEEEETKGKRRAYKFVLVPRGDICCLSLVAREITLVSHLSLLKGLKEN